MSTKEIYIDFCLKHNVPLFFKPFWNNQFAENWEVIIASEKNAMLFFIYYAESKYGFKFIRNHFLTPYSGLIFSDNIDQAIKIKLIESIIKQIPVCDELHIDLHPSLILKNILIPYQIKIKRTNILTLTDIDKIKKNYKPSLKRQLQKAANNLVIEESNDIKSMFSLFEKTFKKQNKNNSIPFTAFKKTWLTCKKNNCGKLFFAVDVHNNKHAAIFIVYDETTSYYLAGGSDIEFYGSGAMGYLLHHCINLSINIQKLYFDFEGSMLPNVDRFFKTFSPEETEYYNISKINSAILKIIKNIKS